MALAQLVPVLVNLPGTQSSWSWSAPAPAGDKSSSSSDSGLDDSTSDAVVGKTSGVLLGFLGILVGTFRGFGMPLRDLRTL